MSLASNAQAAERSKALISSALMTLLKTLPYEKISISKLCNEAGVSRQTFYKNFKTLDNVVYYKLQQIRTQYNKRNSLTDIEKQSISDFYHYIQSSKEYALLLAQNKLIPVFEERVKEKAVDYLTRYEKQMIGGHTKEYLHTYVAAMVIALARKWLESNCKKTAEQMAELTEQMIAEYVKILAHSSEKKHIPDESKKFKKQQLADILNNIPVGICVLFMPDEMHQSLRFVNKQMMRMINPSMPAPEDISPKLNKVREEYYKNAFSGVHPDDLQIALEAFREGFNLQQFRVKPIRLMTSAGEYIWVALDVARREDLPDGRSFYASYRNVSKEIKLKQELEEQDQRLRIALASADKANEAKSVFLSSMSHDLRNPLNGIIGYTALALQETDANKKQEFLEKIQSSGNLLLDMVNDTLDLSRIESGKLVLKPEAVDGKKYWEEIVTAMEPSANVKEINLIKETTKWPEQIVMMDRVQVKKILMNILSNAIKYTPSGGKVYVNVEAVQPPVNGCTRRITVEDTGIGMSKEFMGRMFEPFAQEHRSELPNVTGTGLGLAIVKRIVDFMGGKITVDSVLHKGTKFVVELPLKAWDKDSDVEQQHEAARIKVINEGLANNRILLCEDNYLNAEIVQLLLKNKKVIVDWAKDGQEGLDKFIASQPGYYAMILMDIQMPILNGLQATKAIRELARADADTIPILAMTADVFEETIQDAKQAGMNAYITKPFVPTLLYQIIFEHLQKK